MTDFGRTAKATRAATLETEAASLDVSTQEIEAARDAALAFYVVLFDSELHDAFLTTSQNRQRQLATTKALVASGVRSPIDLTRAEVAYDAAMLDLAVVDATARKDKVVLASTLAMDPNAAIRVVAPRPLAVDTNPARAVERALQANADLLALVRRAAALRTRTGAARAARNPSLELRVGAISSYTRGPDLGMSSPSQQVSASVVLSVPIFDAAITASVRGADAAAAAAEADLVQASLAVRTEATRAALEVSLAENILGRVERVASGAHANLAEAEARFAGGYLGPLEMLDAQALDGAARVSAVRARLDVEHAKVRLLAVTAEIVKRDLFVARTAS